MTIKRHFADVINRGLSHVGARLVGKWEPTVASAEPAASALRLRLFEQIAKKGFNPTHIIDVGAHKGGWSRDAHEVFPKCAFTLIEPQIEMKPYLDRFCSLAKSARWHLAGAGATQGELPLTITPDAAGSSFVYPEHAAKEAGLERRLVPVVTLDAICEQSTQAVPEIVKIDAEGFDLEVMRGSQNLIGVTELFFLEVPLFDYWPTDLSFHTAISFMREHGYEPYDITDLNRRPSDWALALAEIAFAKRAGVLRDHHGW